MRSGERVRNRKKNGESSAQVIASNDDLLTELLLCLPVKSLSRFKSVSQKWLLLISDPHFARRKHLKSNNISAFYLDCDSLKQDDEHYEIVPLDPSETPVPLEHLDFAGHPRRFFIDESSNGLLLCRNGELKCLVYNPTTKQSKTLPPLPPDLAGAVKQFPGPILAFDPSKSHIYKVVRILHSESDYVDSLQIVIYSSETGLWRVSGAPFTRPLREVWSGVYCDGAIHWVGGTDALYFDLNEEVVREMPTPLGFGDELLPRYFGESGGRLYRVHSNKHPSEHLNVYEMERDRSGWFRKFQVGPDALARFTKPSERIRLFSVLYVARGEKEEGSFIVLYLSDDKIIRYNFVSQTHQEICWMDVPVDNPIYVSPPAHPYIESFSSV